MSAEKEGVDLSKLDVSFGPERTERLLSRVHTRLDRRRRVKRSALAMASVAAAAALIVVALRWPRAGATAAPVDALSAVDESAVELREGSKIELDRATASIEVTEESPARVRVDALRGSARYSVVPNPARAFEVHAGAVTVTVVGTEFAVERRGEEAWVEVSRGKVRVSWAEGEAFVAAGESGLFPAPSSAAAPSPLAAEERGEAEARAAHGAPPSQTYRARVARRDYSGAYAVLSRHPALAGDTVEDLLVAADVARLSDHPTEALPYLQRVVRDHPRDERAPLAAFTLGRTLGGLGRHRDAMLMFGRVRSRWPESPLAEDALLREVEAAAQAGDLSTARRLADQYDRAYPNGRRRAEVRRHAKLE